jgi:hypothetical protein
MICPPGAYKIEVANMALTNGGIIMILLFGVGLVLLFSAIAKKHAGPLKAINPVIGAVLGVALIIPGFYWGVAPNLPGFEQYGGVQPTTIVVQQPTTTPTTSVAVPTFEIVPVTNTTITAHIHNSTLNTAKTEFTWPMYVTALDKVTDQIATNGNVFGRATFRITPIAPTGADSTNLATIFYSVSNINAMVDDDRYLCLRSNSATKESIANWTVQIGGSAAKAAVTAAEGEKSTSMLLTDTAEIWFDAALSNHSIAGHMTTLSGIDFVITFHNADYSWSKSYTITVLKLADSCSNAS